MAALTAVFFALFVPHRVAKGERPMVLVLAPSLDQAQTVFGYAKAFISESVVLRKEIVGTTASEIRLRNGVVIAVHPVSFRSVRGRTLLACVFDETAWWRSDDSATPDTEVYSAVLPALATTGGMLIGISTPYRKLGLLHQKWRDHFGQDSPDVLVVQGPTTQRMDIAVEDEADDLGVQARGGPQAWRGEAARREQVRHQPHRDRPARQAGTPAPGCNRLPGQPDALTGQFDRQCAAIVAE